MTQAQPFTILLPYLPNKIANKNIFSQAHTPRIFISQRSIKQTDSKNSPFKIALYKIHGDCTNLHCKTKSWRLLL